MARASGFPSTSATSTLKMLETKSAAVTWYRAIVSIVCARSRNSPGLRQHGPAAVGERPQHLPQRRVKRVLAVLQHHVVVARGEPAGHEPQPVGQPAVPVQRALGGSGRPGGEEAVAQVAGLQRDSGPPRRRGQGVDGDRHRRVPVALRHLARVRAQHQPGRQHAQRGLQPLGGPAGVQRDEHRAQLHQRQVGDRQFQAVAEHRRHPVALDHAAAGGVLGEAVGELVELPVGQGAVAVADRCPRPDAGRPCPRSGAAPRGRGRSPPTVRQSWLQSFVITRRANSPIRGAGCISTPVRASRDLPVIRS